ncbi:HAD family hydrolase [Sinomicrobium weinanense]|uniref:HAD family hydrolase n=1 Tax=Sinomicrobium weinanense TaxID=2842200 RepID=A0A926Q3H8_9FLAO|nr:HAD family hydrolase [Sinomicrobium weinanense]MBC9796944.1 HAD family hydrolase [Sinomicrobium weinanense]MBU3124946.1 HAD family hydrolase [Sinomicrobium weinanense]
MDLSQVKLIATDMDGTLLNSKSQVSDRFFELFEELRKHDIHFVAASGRQHHSIVKKLQSIRDNITIIAENGAITRQQEKELLVTPLPGHIVNETVSLLRPIEDAYIVLCGKERAYIETDNTAFENMFKEYYYEYTRVPDLTEIKDDKALKIAVYSFEGSEKNIYPHVRHLESSLQIKVSGENWLDVSSMDANKGHALQELQKLLKVKKEETLVFGDYNNDLEMMEQAYFSYAMKNAHPNVLNAARFQTLSNDEHGVEHILEKLLEARKMAVTGL